MHTREHILPLLRDALRAVGAPVDHPIVLDLPRRSESRGDLSTGVALSLASTLGDPPHRIAEAIVAALPPDDPAIASIGIAGHGFINITFTAAFHALHLRNALSLGERYGRIERGTPRRVIVERIAAPFGDDGAMIRGALLAHALAALLRWRGDKVTLRLDPRSSATEPAIRSIIDTLGIHDNRRNAGNRGEAELHVLVIDGRHGAMESVPRGDDDGRLTVAAHGGLVTGEQDDGAPRRTGVAALAALIGEMGPVPARCLMLDAPPGSTIRLDTERIARHAATNPIYAPGYALFAVDALLRAAAAIAPFDLPTLPMELAMPAALRLARHLLLFPDIIERSAAMLDLSLVTGYLTETAALTWPLVTEHPLVSASGALDTTRLPLLAAAAMVIRNGLAAIGGR